MSERKMERPIIAISAIRRSGRYRRRARAQTFFRSFVREWIAKVESANRSEHDAASIAIIVLPKSDVT